MRHLSGLERARAALDGGKRIPGGALPAPVAHSWRRCVDLGLDPNGIPLTTVVDARHLRERREQRELLRRLAIAEMQFLYSQITGSNFMIAFADPDGVVLDTISDHHFAATPTGRAIIPGSAWKEDIRGTNALGLVLHERAAAAVYGREHYFACNSEVSCMAAPIFDSTERIVGILDASCAQEGRQHHTMALVRMATTQIENSLLFHEQADQLILAFHPRVEYLYTLSAGIIAVSGDGRVQSVNGRGLGLLDGLTRRLNSISMISLTPTSSAPPRICSRAASPRCGTAAVVAFSSSAGRPADMGGSPIRRPWPVPPQERCRGRFMRRSSARIAEWRRRWPASAKRSSPACPSISPGTDRPARPRMQRPQGRVLKGAFTNARAEGSPGLIRQADKGTLFLDEVGEIPLSEQAVLLRFLDTMKVRPVGGRKATIVDVQIISATNRLLEQEAAQKRFRADLLYRLNALQVTLPPLREREDFLEIVRFLMDRVAPGVAITDAAIESLRQRPWPGNFRELRTTLQRLVIQCGETHIDEGLVASCCGPGANACPDCLGHPLRGAKCGQIRDSYRATGRNVSEVARLLRISRTTIYKHVRDLPSDLLDRGMAGSAAEFIK